jgi:glycosyltransferase involved in cell wall biosynthesis
MSVPNSGLAIYYEADGFKVAGRNVMGRHSAGAAFLKAAAIGYSGRELWAYTSSREAAEVFADQVREIDSSVKARWCPRHKLDTLEKLGTLFYPGPDIAPLAGLRLREGVSSFSLCGVTHTTASHRAMDSIATTLRAPLMPWDAIICTSTAVRETVEVQRIAEQDYLRWRLGPDIKLPEGPQFPIIPLGVHVDDFALKAGEREAARSAFGIADDEVVILFVGRLSFHAKAHPDVMHLALESVARSGKKVTLVQCGWFENDAIARGFREGAKTSAPHVKTLFIDGRQPAAARRSWAAADIFISLADNIQETFGLTPLEAMATGLPVIVADWNGYKDTVREGIDGFRIPTLMPPPSSGDSLAIRYEAGTMSYDRYCGYACTLVSLHLPSLVGRLQALVDDRALRLSMGQAGQERARAVYDWRVVFQQYQNLWAELKVIRTAYSANVAGNVPAPSNMPGRADPFLSFAHYSTGNIDASSWIARSVRIDQFSYQEMVSNPLFAYAAAILPEEKLAKKIIHILDKPKAVRAIAARLKIDEPQAIRSIAVLAKMGLVSVERRSPSPQ